MYKRDWALLWRKKLPIHCIFLNRDPHKGITVNTTWPFTVTFSTWKHMQVLNQTNCVFVPFDHCHLCIKQEPRASTRLLTTKRLASIVAWLRNITHLPQRPRHGRKHRSMTAQTRHWLTRDVLRATVIGYMLSGHACDGRSALQDAFETQNWVVSIRPHIGSCLAHRMESILGNWGKACSN